MYNTDTTRDVQHFNTTRVVQHFDTTRVVQHCDRRADKHYDGQNVKLEKIIINNKKVKMIPILLMWCLF